ncbi:MAG: 3-oxoadipate enol-lactonase [Alphaproteobacteria bacterium]|nr:3-oxoadipate enol-lactonase [Alphaproteobacteria bacterium]
MTGVFTANGVALNYRLDGPEDSPKLVFSNSLGTNLHMWDPQVAALQDAFHILRYDKRGHGKSQRISDPFPMETLAEDVVALCKGLGFEGAHFCGLSIGGMTGQALGLFHPGFFQSLALCATSSQIPEDQHPFWRDRIATVKAHGMAPVVEPVIQRWFSEDFITAQPERVDEIADMLRTTSPEGYYRCSEAVMGMRYTDRLSAIETPTLLIPGELDPALPVEMSEIIAERIPGARMQIIPKAAHLCNLEQPEAFSAILRDWLASQTAP